MYCSSCGAAATQGLSYCNRCGANLQPSESLVRAGKPTGLVWLIGFGLAMMGTPIGGVALVSDLVIRLLAQGVPFKQLMGLAIVMLVMVFGTAVLLTRLLSPLVKAYLQLDAPVKSTKKELSGRAAAAQLEAPQEPVSSVTENTTRAFEPIFRGQNTR
jgi:hypothetical protein